MISNVINFNKALRLKLHRELCKQEPKDRNDHLKNAELMAFSQAARKTHRTDLSVFDESNRRDEMWAALLDSVIAFQAEIWAASGWEGEYPQMARNTTGLLGAHIDSGTNPKKWGWRVFAFWSSEQARMNFERVLYARIEPYIIDDFWGKVRGEDVFSSNYDGVSLCPKKRLLPPWGI